MSDKNIRLLSDLGAEIKRLRKQKKISATALAKKAHRSRDTLYRLEKGEEVTTGALMDILHAMQYTIHFSSYNFPTLTEMRERFSEDEDD